MPQFTDHQLEQAIQDAGKTGPRITADIIDGKIASRDFYNFPGSTVTVCMITLINGYSVIGHSACADPANFDEKIGQDLAFDHARSKIWQLEGYLLREYLHQTT